MVEKILRKLTKNMNLSKEEFEYVLNPKNVLEFSIKLSDGEVVKGYRVQHNNDLGPFKGGIRFHPNVSLDEVKLLSFFMAIKTAVVGIPLGGGKGGVCFNPKNYSKKEIDFVSREFVRKTFDFIGPRKDIPAPDVYTNSDVMSVMVDEYETLAGFEAKASFTGKPIELGGSLGRDTATARGGFFVLEETLKRKGISNPSIAIQGFGNAGMHFAKFCKDAGFRVVSVSDSKGAIKDIDDIDKVIDHKKSNGSVNGVYTSIGSDEVFGLDVDVLVLAALEDSITSANAKDVKAKIIVELANGPISEDAFDLVKGFVIPDILANSGGVIVSYFEYVQNLQNYYWSKEFVDDELKKIIMKAYNNIYGNDMRNNAYEFAIRKILKAAKLRNRL